MQHDTPLITTIVAGLVLAYIFGMIANRFKMPPLVGYLFAGILVGPYTPGFVADQAIGAELAEIGVILLMFGVGLHFSLKDLMSVRALAIPGALVQIGFATVLGLGLATVLGWSIGAGLLFGLALSVASTVVLLKALQDKRLIDTERGRIAVGWLIVEDLAMVLALVLIPAIAGMNGVETGIHDPFVSFVERVLQTDIGIWGVLGLTLIKVAAFVGFMLVVGRRVIPWALHATAHTGSRELFRLAVLAIALGVALGSAVLFGVSLALGAFFAGMILSESELSHRAAQETLPLRDAFAVLFFVSVGMLFNPAILVTNPLSVLATVFIIVIGKSLAAFAIVLLFRRPLGTALTISASLAQIGEFSFILASLGVSLAILPSEGQDLILAGALISIVLNPVVFWAIDLARPGLEARAAQRRAGRMEHNGVVEPMMDARPTDTVTPVGAAGAAPIDTDIAETDDDAPEPTRQVDHTVLVGFGRVGRVVGEGLHASGAPLVVIEDADHAVAAARAVGIEVVVGHAASAEALNLANIAGARSLMIVIPNGYEAGTVCELGRKLNPKLRIIARAHSDEEEQHLRNLGADTVILGEREIGLGMLAMLQGDRPEPSEAAATGPIEPKLPPGDNILAREAAAPLVATALVVAEPLISEAVIVDSPVVAADEMVTIELPAAEVIAVEPATVEAVETGPVESVIILPPPEDSDVPSPATPDTVDAPPEVGAAPAEIDEVVAVPSQDGPEIVVVEAEPVEPAAEGVDTAEREVQDGGDVDVESDAEALVEDLDAEAPVPEELIETPEASPPETGDAAVPVDVPPVLPEPKR